MRKIVIHSPGDHRKLQVEEHPDLVAAPGQVVVETRAVGVNYADVCVRWGIYESAKQLVGWPITPGFEFSGVVKSLGTGVSRFRIGDRVFGVTFFNAYASEVRVSERHLFAVPEGFTFEEAAGFPAVFLTAWHALFQLVRLPPRARLLVHSAGGGVGSALLQLARAEGFFTVGVVGSPHKVDYVRGLGADRVIDKSSEDLWSKVREYAPEGYDAVLDANGPETLRPGYRVLRPTGKLITYGQHSILPKGGSGRMNWVKAAWGLLRMPRFDPLRLVTDNKSVVGFNLSFLFDREDLVADGMAGLLAKVREGLVRAPRVTGIPFEQAGEAHRAIESGQTIGKIVLSLTRD